MRRLPTKRLAYTLTELLVVMALLVVLASLGVGAVSKGYGWVKQRNTETTMTKVLERIVQRRVNDIYKEAREWDTPAAIYEQAAGDSRRAEVLKVLYLYKWSFPQTYSEAYFNVLESMALYDGNNGYHIARAIYLRLFAKAGVTDVQFRATPSAAEMPVVLPFQASACLVAAFESARGSSLDELSGDELSQPDAAKGRYDIPGGAATSNRILVDAWGNPFFFLRHGNFWDNLGARAAIGRAPFQLGLESPPVTPIPAVLGANYYDVLVNNRANRAFTSRWNQDPFDPEGVLRTSERWRIFAPVQDAGSTPIAWIAPLPWQTVLLRPLPTPPGSLPWTHLAPPSTSTNFTQEQDYFRSNFGYRPQPSNFNPNNSPPSWAQEFAPFVIISAGGDGLFTTWDDNLDSYSLKINVASQQ